MLVSLPICLFHPSPLWFSAENVLETWTELPPITQPAFLQIRAINAINGGEADSFQLPVWPAQQGLPRAAKRSIPLLLPHLTQGWYYVPLTHMLATVKQILCPSDSSPSWTLNSVKTHT